MAKEDSEETSARPPDCRRRRERQPAQMQFLLPVRACVFLILCAALGRARTGGDRYYTAAVYEHRLLGDADGGLKANLASYKRAVQLARQQGVDIIVFPEYGLVPPTNNRTEIRPKLEMVPDPKQTTVNPCDNPESFRDRPILSALSCMARENDIVVVANMGGLELCPDPLVCPVDGVLQLNTNVAFGRNGTLLSRYYKERLYFELSMDLPREEQDPIFETEFGTFGMFICFDILYEKMSLVSKLQDVDAVLFSTMWFSSFPFFVSTAWFQAWAIGNNATLLAANIQVPGHALSGSGIFGGVAGPLVHAQTPDGTPKLLVATLPRRNSEDFPRRTQATVVFENGTGELKPEGSGVPLECSYRTLGTTENIYSEFRCLDDDVSNYTLVELRGSEGSATACHGGMCCHLVWNAASMVEMFYLGVSNATNNSSGRYRWAEENCFLARCDNVGEKLCRNFPTQSQTLFYDVTMTANFTTDYVYPSFVGSSLRLVPVSEWNFVSEHNTSTIKMTSGQGTTLIAATLKGRVFHRDPPYVR